ncbi:MAG: AMP-binding protein [Bacteroidales bacterium]|nr:AMP-binding protein [Bacteroidales bacterium]
MIHIKPWHRNLTINNQPYTFKELLAYATEKIVSSETMAWEREVYRFIINWLSDSEDIQQYSSGTTGKTKEIRLPKMAMMHSALNTSRYLNLEKGQAALLCMPVDYIAGKMMVVRCFTGNLNLLLTEPRSLPDLSGHPRIDFCAMVPLQVMNLINCNNTLDPVRKLIIGGSEIPTELEKRFHEVTTEVYATYGMAETSSHIAIKRLNGPFPQQAFQALPGITLSSDQRGCLVVDADYLPQRVVTNDLVAFTGPGTFNWLGRYDNLINSGGIKIVPEEVEALVQSRTLLTCMAVGLPDNHLGQRLVFVFENEHAPDSLPTMKTDFENFLPHHWRPKEIYCVEHFPRNESMKVDRRKLAEMLTNTPPL